MNSEPTVKNVDFHPNGRSLSVTVGTNDTQAFDRSLTYVTPPVPMILVCPCCSQRHIDGPKRGPHHTHACQQCGFVWCPALVDTVGVQFLPGYKDKDA